jgi:hypothetical protein
MDDQVRIERLFVWGDARPDDHDEVLATHIPPNVTPEGARFTLRTWDVRYPPGAERMTEATYGEARDVLTPEDRGIRVVCSLQVSHSRSAQ